MDRDNNAYPVEVLVVAPLPVAPSTNGTVSIPKDFTRILCCAVSCNNWDGNCFGVKQDVTCCCLYGDNVWYKFVCDDTTCCIFRSGDSECIRPREFYREYFQCCCFEYYAALPPTEDGYRIPVIRTDAIDPDFRPVLGDAIFCGACCCVLTGYNCNCPGYCGDYQKRVDLWAAYEMITCKPVCFTPNKKKPDLLCILSSCTAAYIYPYTCAKSISICYCCDTRCALPCDEEVPCVCGVLPFCTICVRGRCLWSCCETYSELTGSDSYRTKNKNQNQDKNSNRSAPGEQTISIIISAAAVTAATTAHGGSTTGTTTFSTGSRTASVEEEVRDVRMMPSSSFSSSSFAVHGGASPLMLEMVSPTTATAATATVGDAGGAAAVMVAATDEDRDKSKSD